MLRWFIKRVDFKIYSGIYRVNILIARPYVYSKYVIIKYNTNR